MTSNYFKAFTMAQPKKNGALVHCTGRRFTIRGNPQQYLEKYFYGGP